MTPDCEESLAWLPLVPYRPSHHGGPRRAVGWAELQARRQTASTRLTDMSAEDAQSATMSDWSDSVLAAEATKAGSASEVTRLIPRPPSRTGKLAGWLACIHCVLERLELVFAGWNVSAVHQTCRGKDGPQMGNTAGDEELLGR